MEFELIDGNKFFKVAWHNTLHGMKFMVLIKAVSLRLKKKQKLNYKACLKEPPPFVSSGVPAVSVLRVRPAPDKAHPCFGAEGHWRERPVGKHTFLLLPAACSCSSVTPGEDGNSPAADARHWPRNNIDGKEMAHGGHAHSADFEPPAKSNLHHKTSELQKKNKQNETK